MLALTGIALVIAVLLLVIAILGFTKWGKGIHESIFGWIPFGNPKLWAIILIVLIIGFTSIGISISGVWTKGVNSVSTASLTGEPVKSAQQINLDCKFASITGVTGATTANASETTYSSDDNNMRHYTVYLKNITNMGAGSINGTLSCTRSGDIEQSARIQCYIKGSTYTNKITPQTDSNTYSILARGSAKSQVDGVAYQQTAYLNDGAVATTSSDREVTDLVFTGGSSAQAKETLGFYFTLPGDTVFNYLRSDQDPQNVDIVCGGQTQGIITIVKQTA